MQTEDILQMTDWMKRQTVVERIADLTILEALVITNHWHTWIIATPDGNIQIEFHCKPDGQGRCRHHSYWLISDNHRASNAGCIETALDYFDDEAQRKFLREASLSQKWIFYGINKSNLISVT
ncbi:hypothetical protein KDA_74640 [Dictyobacter alpinus]|uniref:Uncharacterized protein n=1 Tax=Dictyobacter alpinus TaxID=2014873 RepID=A0A402BKY7_9CHLR|nr:hypothetical protein [Dictyobacter alpinus]GCE31980.1 hypothetical protein KDA_74640 [Dictyobacter alpinus]